jgi:hypothetical protein
VVNPQTHISFHESLLWQLASPEKVNAANVPYSKNLTMAAAYTCGACLHCRACALPLDASNLLRKVALALTLGMGEIPEPIFKFPTSRFLLSKLGSNLPISYSFSTIMDDELRIRAFTFYSILDDRAIS